MPRLLDAMPSNPSTLQEAAEYQVLARYTYVLQMKQQKDRQVPVTLKHCILAEAQVKLQKKYFK